MDKTLEQFFESEGWVKWETTNHGVKYSSWREHGFSIEENDIEDNWGKRRVTQFD